MSQVELEAFADTLAAEIIFSTSSSVIAPFTNQASKADGGRDTPVSSMVWKNTANFFESWFLASL